MIYICPLLGAVTTSPLTADMSAGVGVGRYVPLAEDREAFEGWPLSTPLAEARMNLPVQRVQHLSSSGKIDDFVLGVECVDDGAQARLTLLGTPLTCEN